MDVPRRSTWLGVTRVELVEAIEVVDEAGYNRVAPEPVTEVAPRRELARHQLPARAGVVPQGGVDGGTCPRRIGVLDRGSARRA